MELRQLLSFCTIARTASFTRAAEILGYAQSTISTQIQLLEQELATRLFERNGRQLTLTGDGRCFLNYAKQILQLSADAQAAVSGITPPAGAIIIGAPECLCATRLPALLRTYRKQNPQVKIILKTGEYDDVCNWLRNYSIDIAFFLQQATYHPELTIRSLHEVPMILACGAGHPLTNKEEIGPADLRGETLILAKRSYGYGGIWENILAKAGVYPDTVLEVNSATAMKQCAINGLGITLLPKIAVTEQLAAGSLIDLRWSGEDFGIISQVAYHKSKWLSPQLTSFLSLTQELFRVS